MLQQNEILNRGIPSIFLFTDSPHDLVAQLGEASVPIGKVTSGLLLQIWAKVSGSGRAQVPSPLKRKSLNAEPNLIRI